MRILVVDDDPEIVSLVKRDLAYEGYTVDTASDGTEALAKARDREPVLIFPRHRCHMKSTAAIY